MVYECYEKFFIYLSFKMKFYTFANAMAIAIGVLAATEATPMATEALWQWCDNEWAWAGPLHLPHLDVNLTTAVPPWSAQKTQAGQAGRHFLPE